LRIKLLRNFDEISVFIDKKLAIILLSWNQSWRSNSLNKNLKFKSVLDFKNFLFFDESTLCILFKKLILSTIN
jgi:hypothetical protein